MATGQGQSGGSFAWPDVPELGQATWAAMSGVHPDSPLVGGRGAFTGGVDADFRYRKVALASPDNAAGSDAPMKAHYSELMNLKGNPIGWVLIAAIIYLGLAHVSLQGSLRGRAGKASGGVAAGFKG